MAETGRKINILELDIDVDAITRSTSEFKARLDAAKASLDAFKRSGDTSSEAYVRQKARVDSLNAEYRVSQRELTKLTSIQNTENLSIKEARNLLSVVSSQWAQQASLYGENSRQAQELAKKKKDLTDRLKEEEKKTGDTSRNVGNYAEGVQQAISKTNLFGREISTVTSFLGSFGAIFGALKGDISDATGQIVNAARGTEGLSRAQRAAAITTNAVTGALKLFKIALISTGIGAIVVALGSLVAYFSSTQKGIDAVNKVLTPLKVLFESTFGLIQQFGEAIANAFKDPQQAVQDLWNLIKSQIVNRVLGLRDSFVALGRVIQAAFTFDLAGLKEATAELGESIVQTVTGVDQLGEKIKNIAQQTKQFYEEALERGRRIADLQIEIENRERDIIVSRAEQELQLKNQEIIAKDISKSAAERQAAIDAQLEISKNIVEEENKILDLQIEQLKLKQASNDTSRDEEKELQQLIAQRLKNQERITDIERRNLGAQNQLRKELQQRAQKAQDDAIKAAKAELDLYIAQNTVRAQTLDQEVKLAETIRDEKLKILQQEVEAGKRTAEEAALEEFKIKQEFLNIQSEAVVENADRELQAFIDANQSKLDANQFFTDELLQQEEDRLNAIADKEREFAALRLEQGVINQQEYNDAINAINAENQAAIDEARAEREEAEKAKQAIDLENQRAINEENFLNDFERRSEELEQQRLQEVAAAQQTGADVALINQKFAILQRNIDAELQNARLTQYADTFGQISQLLGEQTEAGKAAAIAQAFMNTYTGVTQVWRAESILPEPLATIQKVVSTGTVLGSGLAAVQKIRSTQVPRFEDGGLLEIGGNRHAQGGTKFVGEDGTTFEAERGELIGVLNRRAAAAFMKFNNKYLTGGKSGKTNFFESGGIVQRGISGNLNTGVTVIQERIDPDLLASKLAEAYSAIPAPKVAVEEINTGQQNFAEVIEGANI